MVLVTRRSARKPSGKHKRSGLLLVLEVGPLLGTRVSLFSKWAREALGGYGKQ